MIRMPTATRLFGSWNASMIKYMYFPNAIGCPDPKESEPC